MNEKQSDQEATPKGTLSRREVIKTGSLAALGLVYTRPWVEVIRPATATSGSNQDYGGSASESESESGGGGPSSS